jgi:putative peptide zinc metalloprotease protein
MSRFRTDCRVQILPFVRQVETEEAVIGLPERDAFIAIPLEALVVLDALAEGRTIGECQESYRERYGETPDLESFLEELAAKGFVASADGVESGVAATLAAVRPVAPRHHFASFPESWAKAIFSKQAMCASFALIGVASGMIVAYPSLLPGWRTLFFERHVTAAVLLLMATGLVATFLHEMAHLVAARAQGVLCRMSLGSRLWILVAETDMTGVWSLPRHKRFLPILAGPLFDSTSASLLVLLLFAHRQGWLAMTPLIYQLVSAVLMGCLLRLLWQCFFFVRTDFYYAYATAFNCKNLMADTQAFLRSQFARLLLRERPIDQRHIPAREMRAVRAYSIFWLLGRGAAFWTLFFVTLPLLSKYTIYLGRALLTGRRDAYLFFDSLTILALQLGIAAAGFILWLRSIYQTWRRT